MDNRIDAIYGRQSIDKKDSISIESQFEFCRYELKGGEAKEYKDKGYSGKNIERPDFQRLLRDIRAGLIRRVIVYKLDRISRSIVDFAKLMELFKQYNVEFVSCTEKFDTSTPMGRAMLNKTLYVMGCFGAPLTDTNKSRYIKNHPYNMAAARTSMIMAATPDTFGFDCVNLIKAVLWGWTGDKTKSYGGAKYATNGVPDEGADTMIKRCKDATASGWDKVDPGEVVWTTGHIGVYIGNGLAVECSPRWANNVQITAVGNIGKKNGYNTRMWKKHGHLPYVTYDKTVTPAQPETVKPVPITEVKAKGVARSFNKAVAGTYTVTAGAGLNVRDAAGTDSRVLVTIPKGTTVKNYGYYTVVNGVKWLYVAFPHKRVNYTGFVHERFLSR